MATESDRWLFLLTMASVPLGCGDDTSVIADDDDGDPSTGMTEAPTASTGSMTTSGTTGIGSTSLDGTGSATTGSSGDSNGSESADADSGTDESTTMAIDPGTTSSTGTLESAGSSESTTGAPLGMCEQWANEWVACYGAYYTIPYLTMICYGYLGYADPMCMADVEAYYMCEAFGGGPCMAMCDVEYDTWQTCEDQVLADMLGCAMLPMVPAVGTIEMQCTDLSAIARGCDEAGYYIPGFSQYVMYPPEYMVDFCVDGAYWIFPSPPMAVGDTCGGAYEELLTCVSGLSCSDLEFATIIPDAYCPTEADSLTCRCELGV